MDYWSNPHTYRKSVWAAQMSSGEIIYQDDYNGDEEPIAWFRLRKRVEDGDNIVNFGLKFMDNEIWLGEADGYYFTNGVIGMWGVGSYSTKNLGLVINNNLKVKTYKCPELILVSEEERELNDNIIMNTCINHT